MNERAKQGLRKIGGNEEGVLRSHMTMWNDRRRDSILCFRFEKLNGRS
jgi:hypothetical protein